MKDHPIMALQNGAGDALAMRRKRLRYRAWHRGTKELDLLLGPFADARAEALDAAGLDRLEALMEEEEVDLLAWLLGQAPLPAGGDRELVAEIADFGARRR